MHFDNIRYMQNLVHKTFSARQPFNQAKPDSNVHKLVSNDVLIIISTRQK